MERTFNLTNSLHKQNSQKFVSRLFLFWMMMLTILFSFLCINLEAKTLTLKELIDYSFENSPEIRSQKLVVDQKEIDILNSKISFLPSLDLATEQGLEGGSDESPKSDTSSELSLTLSETLYNNGTYLRNLSISKLEKKSSALNYTEQKLSKALSIVKIYYSYLNSIENLEITKQQVALLETQFNTISNQYKQGIQTRIDFLRFKTRLQRAKLDLTQNEVSLKNKLEELKNEIGWREKDLEPHKPENKQNTHPKIPSFNVASLVENHRLYQISKLNTDVQEINLQEINVTRWPVISLESNFAYSGSDYLKSQNLYRDSDSTSWSALVKVSWNLFDWGLRKNKTFRARLEKEKYQNVEQTQMLSLTQSIKTLKNNIDQLSQNLSLSHELKKLEEINYKSLERDYRNGRTDYLNLINALNDLASAQRAYFQNYFQLIQLIYEYYYHEGSIIEKIG